MFETNNTTVVRVHNCVEVLWSVARAVVIIAATLAILVVGYKTIMHHQDHEDEAWKTHQDLLKEHSDHWANFCIHPNAPTTRQHTPECRKAYDYMTDGSHRERIYDEALAATQKHWIPFASQCASSTACGQLLLTMGQGLANNMWMLLATCMIFMLLLMYCMYICPCRAARDAVASVRSYQDFHSAHLPMSMNSGKKLE